MELKFGFKCMALFTFTLVVDVQAITSNPDDVAFYLYNNPSDTTDAKTIVYNDQTSFIASSMDCTRETKIIIHGFGANGTMDTTFPANVKHEYLKLFESMRYNIITVDYWKLSSESCPDGQLHNICIPAAVANTPIVGRRIGKFIIWLTQECGLSLNSVHLVAHSLGSPIAGWAGITVINEAKRRIRRISALDPAGPLFYVDVDIAKIRHLHPDDAWFTDVSHTSSTFGNPLPEGMVDFYINGAIGLQPGCSTTDLDDPLGEGCNHASSTKYWAKSIAASQNAVVCVCPYHPSLLASRIGLTCCKDKIVIGEYCRPTTRGTFYVPLPAPSISFEGQSRIFVSAIK